VCTLLSDLTVLLAEGGGSDPATRCFLGNSTRFGYVCHWIRRLVRSRKGTTGSP